MARSVARRASFVGSVAIILRLGTSWSGGPVTAQHGAPGDAPLDGRQVPKFVDPLPIPAVVDGTQPLTIRMCEFRSHVLPAGAIEGSDAPETWVWGYQAGECPDEVQPTYVGPVIVARRGEPTEVTYLNELGSATTTNVVAYREATDQTLHWADPLAVGREDCSADAPPATSAECWQNYAGPIPAVAHLHGAEVPPEIDGGPDAWFTSDGAYQGPGYHTKSSGDPANGAVYTYPNTQPAAPLWFHDHTLGITRLSVYAGLAGAYLLTDPQTDPSGLPDIIPLVIQDRAFDEDGQLYYPAGHPDSPNPEHPFWVPEFLGDVIAVNGRSWPYLEVEPRRYRFLVLNGSNARAYEMFLSDQATGRPGPAMWQISTDGGYLDAPVRIDPDGRKGSLRRLVLMPGERADIIVDFSGLEAGTRLVLRNVAAAPYPGGDPAERATTGRIMQFRVGRGPAEDPTLDPATPGLTLRGGEGQPEAIVRLADPTTGELVPGVEVDVRRQLTLNEVMREGQTVGSLSYEGGPLEALLNNSEWHGSDRPDFTPIAGSGGTLWYSERPVEGTTEVWEFINLTGDAHPIHLHLTDFQILSRQAFDVDAYSAVYHQAYGVGAGEGTGDQHGGHVRTPGEGNEAEGQGPPLDAATANADGAIGGNPAVGPFLAGPSMPPAANEAGWKDTVIVPPGMVTRVVVRWAPTELPVGTPVEEAVYPFDPSGGFGYVWHCHILEHEDNEMMRPFAVVPVAGAARSVVEGTGPGEY